MSKSDKQGLDRYGAQAGIRMEQNFTDASQLLKDGQASVIRAIEQAEKPISFSNPGIKEPGRRFERN